MNKKIIFGVTSMLLVGASSLATATNVEATEKVTGNTEIVNEKIDTKETGEFVVTAKSGANIRKGPGTNYGILTAVPKGTVLDRVQPEPTNNGWYNVVTRDGKYRGWISNTTGYPM